MLPGLLTCCLLLGLLADSRQLSITQFAVPSAVEAGKNAELQCRHSDNEDIDYVKWWWTPLYVDSEDKNRVLIYQKLTGQAAEIPRKNVEGKENDTIVIMDLKAHDSGVYECEVSNVGEVRRHQELIVFSNGTGVELNVTTVEDGPDDDDDEDVYVQCEVHDVTPQPELSLFVNGKELENITQYLSGGEGGLYDIFVNTTISSDEAEDAEIRCELFYENRNVNHPPYVSSIYYTSGAGSTTEMPEDTTLSEVASELKNTNGALFRGSCWVLTAAFFVFFHLLLPTLNDPLM